MPWTVKNPPKVAKHWTRQEKERCVAAANQALKDGKSDAQAIFACIHAAGKTRHPGGKASLTLAESRAPLALTPLPFAGAIDSARRRGVVLPEVYYGELTGLARALAFTVSQLSTVDQIDRVLKALVANLEEGKTFVDFKREVEQDPDVGRLPRGRVETIFRTGVQTAYNRGRAEHHVQHRDTRPYLMYSAINDSRVRPAHLAMHGVIEPVDHPIWHRWYPPSGFNCRCSVISITREEAERRGVTIELPDAQPDPGFDYSVMDDPALGVIEAAAAKRQSVNPALADLVPEGPPARLSLEQMIERGREATDGFWNVVREAMTGGGRFERLDEEQIQAIIQAALARELELKRRPTRTPAKVKGHGQGPDLVREASRFYPDTWTHAADKLGPLRVKHFEGRGWQFSLSPGQPEVKLTFPEPFGVMGMKGGEGLITTSDLEVSIHEYAHRLQAAMPELDDYFQQLHEKRTAGEPWEKLKDIEPRRGYEDNEVTRKDSYMEPYMGRFSPSSPYSYSGRANALEIMATSFQYVLGPNTDTFHRLIRNDRELFELTVGLILNYDP